MPSLMWVGIIQYSEGLNRTKRGGKANSLSQHQLRYLDSDQDLTISPTPNLYHPNSQAFRLRTNCTTGFPGSPACRGHILGLPDEGAKGKLRAKHKLTLPTSQPPPLPWDMCDILQALLAAQEQS